MKHSFIDEYSGLNSLIHRLDPRTKLVGSLAFILAVVLTPVNNWKVLAVYLGIVVVLVLLSRLPLRYLLKKSLVIIPFVIMITIFVPFFKQGQVVFSYNLGFWHIDVTYEGLSILLNVIIKSWLCIMCLVILSSSTKFAELLQGMYQLRVPLVFVQIMSFMYRYIFVLADQAMRMQMARDSRNFGNNRKIVFNTLGNMIGMLFIRSYERGERIYAAMLSRGYAGEIPITRTLQYKVPDACFTAALVVFLVFPAVIWW
ncbi:MAG: cobalt ECF transporter T component CbiQ [Dehalococcoidia bacterium]|nr:cobalt ECF transporter T component CbiQ [Dehalococcoidia bacterium]MDD5495138.1 cobalt ECF transporter T component CbiQ [Dehalococcoidia bacterium]